MASESSLTSGMVVAGDFLCSVKEHLQLSEWLFETVRYCTWSYLSTIVLQFVIIIQTHHHHSFHFILQVFTSFIHIMFSLIPSDANDPQGLMRR